MKLNNVIIELPGPISNEQIPKVYALAERFGVGIYLEGNSVPRDAVSRWSGSGSIIRLLLAARAMRKFLRNS